MAKRPYLAQTHSERDATADHRAGHFATIEEAALFLKESPSGYGSSGGAASSSARVTACRAEARVRLIGTSARNPGLQAGE
jgi:hypothetical protein